VPGEGKGREGVDGTHLARLVLEGAGLQLETGHATNVTSRQLSSQSIARGPDPNGVKGLTASRLPVQGKEEGRLCRQFGGSLPSTTLRRLPSRKAQQSARTGLPSEPRG